jgi:hypothetical protein
MVATPAQAAATYKAQTRNEPGMCLRETRRAYKIAARESSASKAWARAIGRHSGDRTPPYGAPVFWTGGSNGHGHIAIYVGNGYVRSSDATSPGRMGTRLLSWYAPKWGLRYAGWAEGFNGVRIPGLREAPQPKPTSSWAGGPVYVSKLRYGQRDSDSVKRLQYRLNQEVGAGLPITGNYLAQTDAAVRKWQKKIGDRSDPVRRSSLGPKQARRLFGSSYSIR